MFRIARSKIMAFGLILCFLLFYSPWLLVSETIGKGNVIGFVFDNDGTSPVKGAVVKMRNVTTGSVCQSPETNEHGIFTIEGIDEGLYIIGISAKEGDFNVGNFIGIKADDTAKVSFALKAKKAETAEEGKAKKEKKKRGGIAGFFLSPAGVATIVASSAAIVYTLVKLLEAEPEASPFRK